jgi:cytochrome c biogenesis protein CcmG, thiol:disulfide interchange protein DsbE
MPRLTARRGALVLVALAVAGLVVAELLSGTVGTKARRAAPALPATVLAGDRVTLAGLRGRPVIVHFWASWCGPCEKEAPELAALPAQLHGRATLVGVDWSDDRARGAAFVRRHDWGFPNLQDGDGAVGNAYGLAGLPTTYLLDARGRIVRQMTGPQTVKRLLAALPAAS